MSGAASIPAAAAPTVPATAGDGVAVLAAAALKPVKYPNRLNDVAVIGRTGSWQRSFLLRPKYAGRFLFLLYPRDDPRPETLLREFVHFTSFNSRPQVLEFLIPPSMRDYVDWDWRLVKMTFEATEDADYEILDAVEQRGDGMLHGPDAARFARSAEGEGALSSLIFDIRPSMDGHICFTEERDERTARTIAWSCHQPYETKSGHADYHPNTKAVLRWYRALVEEFNPHRIWALGDTAYSDGIGALNFVRQVYDQTGWHRNWDLRKDLLSLFRLNYRYHWSFGDMQAVMRRFPHVAMWDDHEIRDGYGSESADFTDENSVLKDIARQAAEEYLFSWSTRLRTEASHNQAVDNHQAYVDRPVASFIFDGRNSRNYGEDLPIPPDIPLLASAVLGLLTGGLVGAASTTLTTGIVEKELIDLYRWNNPGEVISTQQLDDFARFCQHIRGQRGVRYLLLGNSVPFIYINDMVEALMSELDLAAGDVAQGVRDDVRDSWHSPGNRRQLNQLIAILRDLHQARPDIEIVNVSGDIHISNAFSAKPDGFSKPIYQITSSALTNRGSMSEGVAGLLAVGSPLDVLPSNNDFGEVKRLWQEARFQNFVSIDASDDHIAFHLHVYNRPDDLGFGARDRRFVIRQGGASGVT